ncbi:hypothetical protein ACHAXA_002827 [Cyclostephanos tholiformis]|uniref:Mut7-C RNAse domain-containing protein n=1 Tax=Cyclostephanos tholiformis TaxID=382380 RepID=A0ABD3RZU7_9STRA
MQELDLVEDGDPILPAFESWGYNVIRTPNDKRKDCCAIAYDLTKFDLIRHDVVRFDDLSTLMLRRRHDYDQRDAAEDESMRSEARKDGVVPGGEEADTTSYSATNGGGGGGGIKSRGRSNNSPAPEMTGMVWSFLRRNCAIVAHLRSIRTGESIIVASVHLYWHPGYEYVKLCQAKYLLDFVDEFAMLEHGKGMTAAAAAGRTMTPMTTTSTARNNSIPAIIICGDINSKPGSIVHRLFVETHVDARTVAPWRYFWDQDNEEIYKEEEVDNNDDGAADGRGGEESQCDNVSNSSNERSEDAAPQRHDHDLDLHRKDLTATTTSDLTPVFDEEDGTHGHATSRFPASGYMMSGLSADFTAYCGMLEPNFEGEKDKVVDIDAPKPIHAKHDPSRDEVDANHDDLKSYYENQLSDTAKIDNNRSETNAPDVDPAESHDDINVADNDSKASLAMRRLMKNSTPQDYEHSTPPMPVKYMLDYTLNRLTRWLRLLGIDARLEKLEEEKERTSGGKIALFDHCKNERRALLTTSYKLLLRKDCPPGAYLVDTKSTSYLEQTLPRIFRTHGVELSPCTFLTRCVLCNGDIIRVLTDEEKRAIFIQHDAPAMVGCNLVEVDVFRCSQCLQGYWWDERPASSASRSFNQTTRLLRICLRGGVALKDETATDKKHRLRQDLMGAFEFVDVSKEREAQDLLMSETNELAVVKWLNEDKLSSPFKLKSAMALGDSAKESIPFTNVTKEFAGTLDYVFFAEQQFEQLRKLTLPTSFRQMNPTGLCLGHLIPSNIWPSDHIAVGARLRLKRDDTIALDSSRSRADDAVKNKSTTNTSLKPHARTCGCGCVPQILSLFEMAELRRKTREVKDKMVAI